MDLGRLNRLLRQLSAEEEKVIRLHFGLGCERSHAVDEIAQEFGVAESVIAGILEGAQGRLGEYGVTASGLQTAARQARWISRPIHSRSGSESRGGARGGGHRHHQA